MTQQSAVVLLQRIYVLYDRSRVMGISIGLLLFAGFCGAAVIGAFRPTVSRYPFVHSLKSHDHKAGISFSKPRGLPNLFLNILTRPFQPRKYFQDAHLYLRQNYFGWLLLPGLWRWAYLALFVNRLKENCFRLSDLGFSSSERILHGRTHYRPLFFLH